MTERLMGTIALKLIYLIQES